MKKTLLLKSNEYVDVNFIKSIPFSELLILNSHLLFWKIIFQSIAIDRIINKNINYVLDDFFSVDFLLNSLEDNNIPTEIKEDIKSFFDNVPGDKKYNILNIDEDVFVKENTDNHLLLVKILYSAQDIQNIFDKFIAYIDKQILILDSAPLINTSIELNKKHL